MPPPTSLEEATFYPAKSRAPHRTAPRVSAPRPSGSARASQPPWQNPCRSAAPPPPGSPPAGDPSATFPPEEGHGGARVGAEGAGGLSRGGPCSPHSAAGWDFRVRRSRRTSPKTAPSSGCGRCHLLGMPGQLLPPCYQQATRPEFRSFRARGFTGGPGPAPSRAPPPAGPGSAPAEPTWPGVLASASPFCGWLGLVVCLRWSSSRSRSQHCSAAFPRNFAKWSGLTGSFALLGLPDAQANQRD